MRDLLIALNATRDVDRAALCRLGGAGDWLERRGRGRPILGKGRLPPRGLGVVRRRLERAEELAAEETRLAIDIGADLVTRADAAYPEALLQLTEPPPVLYAFGSLPRRPGVAIVGSRDSDAYGLETAESFAAYLAETGMVVVSGMARGVDSAAHRGALSIGATVAVLGCALDIDYPRGSRQLVRRIAESGAVISEFPIGTPPHKQNFPMRNRIIAALGLGTLVVRAAARSGSLITARLALELGRDVYALPGNVFDPRSIGPNTLIRDGALPVQHPREIVESLPRAIRDQLLEPEPGKTTVRSPEEPRLRRAYEAIPETDGISPEELSQALGTRTAAVLAILTELEIGGWVHRESGPRFRRC